MSNILVNLPDLSKEYGGVYQYSVALLKILAQKKSSHEFFIFCHNPDPALTEIIDKNQNFHHPKPPSLPYYREQSFRQIFLNRLSKRLKLKKNYYKKDVYDWLVKELNIDIIHTPYQVNIQKPGVKSITTLHDVQELHFPEFFTSAQRAHRAVNYKKAIDEADAVIVSYDHVKKDIIKYFKKPEVKVFTVLLDMQKLWFENTQNTFTVNIGKKYNLSSKFILYPAASWQHKNHLKLIEAIEFLNDPNIQLICTGNMTEHYFNNILPFIEEKKLSDQIKFLGIVTDEELLSLYKKCRAVVVPTLYEAGSFPLMESILMGIPVICSNVTSLPETIGDNRFVFDPINIVDMADKINLIWQDDFYRNENKALLKIQAEKIKNNNAASKMNMIYESLFSN